MAVLLPSFTKAIIDHLIESVSNEDNRYYAFASNPVEHDAVPDDVNVDLETMHRMDWMMLFGKRIAADDLCPVIANHKWTTNTVYQRYDNTIDIANSSFYVVVDPDTVGGDYQIFKCIDNANGAPSTSKPDQLQATTFSKSDGYSWRYISSIPTATFTKFGTTAYCPIEANSTIVADALSYSSVDVCKVVNGGSGYNGYHDGTVRSVINSTLIQIDTGASVDNDFYTKSGIYIYNDSAATSQLKRVQQYVANLSGNWVYLDSAANTDNILSGVTEYTISPYVNFDTNGESDPVAYSVVNTIVNSVSSIVIVDPGTEISRANVSILANTSYGSGANVIAIVPPPGGHGADPVTELYVKGLSVSFQFANSESNTIPTNILYNRIGIMKDPYAMSNSIGKGDLFEANTFTQLFKANVSPSHTFTVGEYIQGQNSLAIGLVAFSNSTQVHFVGDKRFTNGESIVAVSGSSSIASIIARGDLYGKEVIPLYVQNIDNVDRAAGQTEGFKVIIEM